MKVLVTGVNGQLGHDVMLELSKRGHEAIGSGSGSSYRGTDAVAALPYVELEITDRDTVLQTIGELRPDAVIHCAAWTAVDAAEDAENREKVDRINHLGTLYIAEAARAVDA